MRNVFCRPARIGLLVFAQLLFLAGCSGDEQVVFADGSHTQMSHWDDRYLVINYWAEWCAPCRHEIPEFNALHEARVANGIVMLGVNYDNLQGEKLTDVIERMDIQFPVLAEDPQERYGYERAQTLPMTVIINPAREVHDVLIGPQTQASVTAALN
ncbi:MAG: TlpA disulfide reductase family protein [Pseudomonadota bacterium]